MAPSGFTWQCEFAFVGLALHSPPDESEPLDHAPHNLSHASQERVLPFGAPTRPLRRRARRKTATKSRRVVLRLGCQLTRQIKCEPQTAELRLEACFCKRRRRMLLEALTMAGTLVSPFQTRLQVSGNFLVKCEIILHMVSTLELAPA